MRLNTSNMAKIYINLNFTIRTLYFIGNRNVIRFLSSNTGSFIVSPSIIFKNEKVITCHIFFICIDTIFKHCTTHFTNLLQHTFNFRQKDKTKQHITYKHTPTYILTKTKRRRSDPVLWQKPLHQQKCQKGKATTQTTPQKLLVTLLTIVVYWLRYWKDMFIQAYNRAILNQISESYCHIF